MKISNRVSCITDSITLRLNALAVKLAESGQSIFNLTAGQLPNMPDPHFQDIMASNVHELKSYQYSPAGGFEKLRAAVIEHIEKSRNISFDGIEVGAVICSGAKQCLYNTLTCLLNPGDEVLMLAPYWISYIEMIKLCGGVPVCIPSSSEYRFMPDLEVLKNKITDKTRAIIINSPNNPSGVHYSDEVMKELGKILVDHQDISIISDEIYFELSYMDIVPKYCYQFYPELLQRTVIIDGISKSFACTGLRMGYLVAPKTLTVPLAKLQGQTASGPNSLTQLSSMQFGFDNCSKFLTPINEHIKRNALNLRAILEQYDLGECWYQTTSAFYFLFDFSKTPVIEKYRKMYPGRLDVATFIAEDLLKERGVALVPAGDFGANNAARLALVMDEEKFIGAIHQLAQFCTAK